MTRINSSILLLSIHLALGSAMYCFSIYRNRKNNLILNYISVLIPILSLIYLHYETGLLNQVIFHHYFDSWIQKLDLAIFGGLPNQMLSKIFPNNFTNQIFHFFYFTLYPLLFCTVTLIFFKESGRVGPQDLSRNFWGKMEKTQSMLFTGLLTMFVCYWIFLFFPVIGPTAERSGLFPDSRGFISLLNCCRNIIAYNLLLPLFSKAALTYFL